MNISPISAEEDKKLGVLALLELALDTSEEYGLPFICRSELDRGVAHLLTAALRTPPLYYRPLLPLLFFRSLCGLDSIELDGILDDFFVVEVARHCELAHQAFHVTPSLQTGQKRTTARTKVYLRVKFQFYHIDIHTSLKKCYQAV